MKLNSMPILKLTPYSDIMKQSLILTAILAFLSLATMAQGPDMPPPPTGKAREKIDAARAAMITERLGLTPEQAEKFWPIYHEFADRRHELRKEFGDARRQLDPRNPDPAQQQKLIDLGLDVRQKELNLEKDYSGRFLNVITPQQMLKLRGAERDFQQMVMQQLQQRRNMQQRKENFRDKNQQLHRRGH